MVTSKTVEQIIADAKEKGGSDVHLVKGIPIKVRIDGDLDNLYGMEPLTEEECRRYAQRLCGEQGFNKLQSDRAFDKSETISGVPCRINVFGQQGAWSAALRLLNDHIPNINELGLPGVVLEFSKYSQGIVLVTGETGSGKSTTLASIIEEINRTRQEHVLTIEDPIEYVYEPKLCAINQREIGRDVKSFTDGLREALREDPDIILVGEMRDLDTIETALTAAETGHLVFGTIHTNSCADSVDRIVGVFPAERQQQIRLQLSMTLKAVVSQQLLRKQGGGRVVCCEVMKLDNAIRNLIREGKTPQIENVIQTTGAMGNILMDKALQELYNKKLISRDTMKAAAHDAETNMESGYFKSQAGLTHY